MFSRCIIVLLLISSSLCAQGQQFQNGWSYRNIAADHYFRLNYENDGFFGTDYYFTQGVHFELVAPGIGKLPTRRLLLHPRSSSMRYGIALESAGYTPMSLRADTIRYGDRPYAGMAYLKAFAIANDASKRSRYNTSLALGLMGPAAGGREIQAAIHEVTGNDNPQGWQHQIGNVFIANYEFSYEHLLVQNNHLLLSHTALIRVGTFSTKASIGAIVQLGKVQSPFEERGLASGLYAYVHPQLDIVGYDATLQGSLFSNNSPYVIKSSELARLVGRFDIGLRYQLGKLLLSTYLRYLSREFRTGHDHAIGGIELGIRL